MTRGEAYYLGALGDDTSTVTFTDEEAGTITGKPAKSSKAAKKVKKHHGSAIVDKSPGASDVPEKVAFLGTSVSKSLVPEWLHSKAAQFFLLLVLGGGGYLIYQHYRRGGRSLSSRRLARANPERSPLEDHRDRDVARAAKFRREFHWGNPARRVVSRRVALPPRVMTDLGEVAEITYKTDKRGERAQFFTHDFEGRRPRLGVDPRSKRLHLVGGSYTVAARGITG